MIGTSLNQYRITATLGAGGMGEVFRARDTRLNRDVAVKVKEVSIGALSNTPARALTQGTSTDRQPSYSRDGEWVIFSSNRTGRALPKSHCIVGLTICRHLAGRSFYHESSQVAGKTPRPRRGNSRAQARGHG
jgi:hypothetical protein